ncbi:hypothetical protein C8R45DRAFT_1111665 [Mycena sanguinolenta]|nr:hypothetical protein C8R45DRAFT_1111665 [Mycena sanguinolenta]
MRHLSFFPRSLSPLGTNNIYAVAKLLRLLVRVPILNTVDRRAAHPEVLSQILVLGIDEAPRAAALMMRFGANESIGFRWASYIFVFGFFVGFDSSLRGQLRRACLSGVLCRAKSTSISSSPSLLHSETKAFAPVRVVRGLVRIDCLRCATASASQSASTVLGLSHLGALDTPLLFSSESRLLRRGSCPVHANSNAGDHTLRLDSRRGLNTAT